MFTHHRLHRRLLTLLLLCVGPALAGGFSVLPTRVTLAAERAVQSVMLTNTSAQTVTVESQVVVWPEGADGQLAADVVVTPAVVTLPPGQRVRVRIGLLRGGDGAAERAYRIYFTELPAPAPLQGAGIGVRLRVGIPVFVVPLLAQPQPLQWRALHGNEGWQLEAHNPGNVHARMAEPALVAAGQTQRLESPSPYVLAGAVLRMALPAGAAPPQPVQNLRLRWMDGDDARDSAVALP